MPVPVGMWVLVTDTHWESPERWDIWMVIWSDEYGVLGRSKEYDSVRRYIDNYSVIATAESAAELKTMQGKAEKIYGSYGEEYRKFRSQWLVDNPGHLHGEMRDAIAKEIEVPRGILQSLVFKDY